MRAEGILVQARLQHLDIISNEFEAFPAGIPVKIMDSKPSAPQALVFLR